MRRLFAALLLTPALLDAQRPNFGGGGPPAAAGPSFRYVGPEPSGRISAVAGSPGDTMTYFLGGASGGVWKTTDGGRTWAPTFDDQPVQAIGSLAVAPSNPRIVWAGTGEAWAIRDADMMGDGIYKSTDGGQTWTKKGLDETGRIGRIIVHPTNPNIVFACALGRATGPQEERGVFKTTDGGETWKRVLFVDPKTGCSGLSIDLRDPKVLYAGTWEVVMHTWGMFSGGPGSGVYVSRDTGSTWQRLDKGLPKSPVGKIDVAVAPNNSARVFALIQTADQGSLWRSDDSGHTWKTVSWDRRLIGRAGYYIRITVNPLNDNEVLVASSSLLRSFDGGQTFPTIERGCGDCHDIWMDMRNPSHWIITGDGGAGITRNHGQNYFGVELPVGQMYHVNLDDRVPYWLYANRQDDGTMRGPNNSPVTVANVPSYGAAGGRRGGGDASNFGAGGGGGWQAGLGGCESGFTIPVPGNTDIIYSTCYGSKITRFDNRTGRARTINPMMHTLDAAPNDLKYRCHWSPPLAIDPFDHKTVYFGCQVIFKTTNEGQSWSVMSPDLSTNDPRYVVSSGGIIADNLGQFYGEVVFAIAPSPIQKGLIWAGTNDGKVWYTANGGGKWNDVSKNITGMPALGTIRRIEPSRFDAGTAYIAVDLHLMDDRAPYLYKTTDFGKTWTKISDGLPQKHPLDYVMTVAENPHRRGMLFAGTGHGFYYSLDDGKTWKQHKDGLPAAPVSWIAAPTQAHDVAISTYGRGLYVMNDITTLEQQDKVTADAPMTLYTPGFGYRFARNGTASFNLRLAKAPKDSLKIEIQDSTGTVVRTFKTTGRAGLNRLTWDLRYDSPKAVELRTVPPDNPNIWSEARFKDRKPRPINHWGIEGSRSAGPLASAGKYTVRVTADSLADNKPFTVIRDPGLPSTDADLQLSTRAQQRIRDDINAATEIVNKLEVVRQQVEDLLEAAKGDAARTAELQAFAQKALDVERMLVTKTDLHSDDKWFVEKTRVLMNLYWLNGEVGTGAGDVAGGADYRPTDTSMESLGSIEKDLNAAKEAFKKFVDTDLKKFNESLKAKIVM